MFIDIAPENPDNGDFKQEKLCKDCSCRCLRGSESLIYESII